MMKRTVKFGSISAQSLTSMIWDRHYSSDREANSGAERHHQRWAQRAGGLRLPAHLDKEPHYHLAALEQETTDQDFDFLAEALNREIRDLDAEIRVHTYWGNPNQQRGYWEQPSYGRAMLHLHRGRRRCCHL